MRYLNPLMYGDYSDPDVIRVGEDFYMISSSFTYLPGIPVLHSRDLVHWELIGYAAEKLPFPQYDRPAHKRGTWAPSIRYARGRFYVYVCLPDEGLLAFTAEDPAGPWECHYVKDVTGWIDPCPLFDEDGKCWLVHGLAASRIGINNMLFVHEMSPDGLRVLDKGHLVYNGEAFGDTTVEGPKIYRRKGTCWILCPAGGVKEGYQLALRADSILGPYERRVVLAQGNTKVNGPHQGGWIEDGRGGDWFIHFQDVGVYGRIPHLQPVDWSDGWPVMGRGGEPVSGGDTGLPSFDGSIPLTDLFPDGPGLPWQWQANPDPRWCRALRPGIALQAAPAGNLFHAGQFLSRLMPFRNFDMDAQVRVFPEAGDLSGIGMMGYDYCWLATDGKRMILAEGHAEETGRRTEEKVTERVTAEAPAPGTEMMLRMRVRDGRVRFFFGESAESLRALGEEMPMSCGGWTGARPGIFAMNTEGRWGGSMEVRSVRIRETASDE